MSPLRGALFLHKRHEYPPLWFALIAQATSCTDPAFHTVGFFRGSVAPSCPSLVRGGTPAPLPSYGMGPPPATPQPEPRTGAVPGARHGFFCVTSCGPPLMLTFRVRNFWPRVGLPTISDTWENHIHAPWTQAPPSFFSAPWRLGGQVIAPWPLHGTTLSKVTTTMCHIVQATE